MTIRSDTGAVDAPADAAAQARARTTEGIASGAILRVARMGAIDYPAALEIQQALVGARLRDRIGDTLLVLEHPHVFTLGRGADERFLVAPPPQVPVYRVSRGGQVTYHGPGQIVGYPILKLEGPARDVALYLRRLEAVMIGALARHGIAAHRRDRQTGVWVGARKLGSIGVGIRRWVTLHGFALNVCPDLSLFDAIVPCGIKGCIMTSVAALGHPEISMADMEAAIEASFAEVFGYSRIEHVDTRAIGAPVDDRGSRRSDAGAA